MNPYRNPAPVELDWDLIEQDDYTYDSDDSEEWEFPVRPEETIPPQTSTTVAWESYHRDTRHVVTDALAAKTAQILKLNASIASWSTLWSSKAKNTEQDDTVGVIELLDSIRLEQEVEDRERQSSLQERCRLRNTEIESVIESEIRKGEDARRCAEALEAESQRKIAAAEEEAHRAVSEEQARKEKEKQLQVAATKEKEAAAKQAAAVKEQAELVAKNKALAEKRQSAVGQSSEAEAIEWKDQLENFRVTVLKSVSESPELKNFCHKARSKINPRVGQVTNSIQQIGQVSAGLKALFDEAGTKDPHKLAQLWCLNFFAKAIVRQAEGEVRDKPTACYPLAFLAISMMKHFPALKDIYLCRLARKCPWIIPYVAYDKDTESGRKSLGWKRGVDDKYEATTAYTERQEGIFRLWAATTSLKLQKSPYPIEHAWIFISRLLNAKIQDEELKNVSFVMAASFLDIAGKNFLATYGNQASKIIRAIGFWVGPDIKGPNASRLRILVEEYVKQGRVGLAFDFAR